MTRSKQTTDGVVYGTDAAPMTYAYNLSGAMIEQKYPSGRVVKNVLDADGDLSIVQSKKNANSGFFNYAKNFTYTSAGAVNSMQLRNNRWESTQFNSRLQPTQIALGTTQGTVDKLKLDYSYGSTTNNGNVLSQQITVPTVGSNPGFIATQTEVDLDFAQARIYGYSHGRFTSPDPLLTSSTIYNPQTWNKYVYVLNNPLVYTDPTGLYTYSDSLGGNKTDEELRKEAGTDKKKLKAAEKLIDKRKDFRDGLTAAGRARDALPAGADRTLVSESLAAYGAEGVANGVTVGTGRLADGVAAQATTGAFSYNADGSITANVAVTISDRNNSGNLAIDIAHEGRHVADAQVYAAALTADIEAGGANAVAGVANRTRYEREVRGYTVSSLAARGLGLPNLNVGRREIWNSSWRNVDDERLRAINNHLRESATYLLTPEAPGERYQRRPQ